MRVQVNILQSSQHAYYTRSLPLIANCNVAFRHRYSIGTLGFIRSTNPEIISLTPLDTGSLSLIFHSRTDPSLSLLRFLPPLATDRGINRAQMKLGGSRRGKFVPLHPLRTSASLVFACYTLLALVDLTNWETRQLDLACFPAKESSNSRS